MRNFALIGAAGFIAPRHMKAIRETGNNLLAATDPHDSVGIMDSFSNNVEYFKEYERFDRFVEKQKRKNPNDRIHFVSICSPNYLHDAHIRFALRVGADAICEKPLVLNPWNLDALHEIEVETSKKINTILQLRLHPSIKKLRDEVSDHTNMKKKIVLTYITSRGNWYNYSWKGELAKSGGLVTNIGIHFFDMLIWIFGKVLSYEVHLSSDRRAAGFLELERADVKWLLSIDRTDIPGNCNAKSTYRSLTMDGKEIEFSEGFTDLHTESYSRILDGNGFGIEDARPSVALTYSLRNEKTILITGNAHPFLKKTATLCGNSHTS
ncbi:MAG: Gfo/Idh/MocA family oxidoreductase [Candidatus Wallbacteria bacterium]|nr:Gfo/Idh/MocA family oxidoreductase [Candidatus Wallbacteria bacterium]